MQLVARIDALNLVIHLKSAVTLRSILIVIGFKKQYGFRASRCTLQLRWL
ncbi:hypothetical protein HMPREF9065_01796 [Aggregatibacter sp. oral taxon 458 str. W10330]|nr:hypothetical protein HMPREF9065_01796 [Aggregatibacter sp. oral taxon 458 str. W10330]